MMFGLSCCIQAISIFGEDIFVELMLLSDPNLRNIISHSICVAVAKYETS